VVGGPADGGGLIDDEDSVFLKRVNYPMLAELRAPADDAGRAALAALVESFSESALVAASQRILLLVERQYDRVIWQTLQQLAAANNLNAFLAALRAKPANQTTRELVVAGGAALGLENGLIGQWVALVP
jgi:hypothetical protein